MLSTRLSLMLSTTVLWKNNMTQIIHDIKEMQAFCRQLNKSGKSLGFVPTMGNLHQGHLSLMQRSQKENMMTAVSIFVNPTQFNDPNDFTKYPRTFAEDLQLLKNINVDVVFAPDPLAMYPDQYQFSIQENQLSLLMEGKHRPGHFQGMLTVVMKLLQIVHPDRAYFGEKDYQQYLLIRGLAEAFFLDTAIIACETVREPSGLAFSSRNNLLSTQGRQYAANIKKALSSAENCTDVATELQNKGFKIDYVEEYAERRLVAVYLEGIRLIDNIRLG